jgi:hypothetical protein
MSSLLERYGKAIEELRPEVQWAARRWFEECGRMGFDLTVAEVYRTQERQNYLYSIGRRGIHGEVKRTWTLKSYHTLRLAMDVYPINCKHSDLEALSAPLGITHPLPGSDPPHYEFRSVGPQNPVIALSIEAKIQALRRGIERSAGEVAIMLQRQLERLLRRIP